MSMPDQSKILLHMPSGTAVCALIGSTTNLPELLLSSASALTASTFGYTMPLPLKQNLQVIGMQRSTNMKPT